MKKTISVILVFILFFGFSGGQFNRAYAGDPAWVAGGTSYASATLLTDQSSYLTLIPTEDWSTGWEMWHNDYPYFKFIPAESGVYTLTVTGYGESSDSTFDFQIYDIKNATYIEYESTVMNYDTPNEREITIQAGVAYYIYVNRSTKNTTNYMVEFDKTLQTSEDESEPSMLTIAPIGDITMNSLEGSLPRVTVKDENGDEVTGKTKKYTCEELSDYGTYISSSDRYIELGSSTPNGTYTVTVSLTDDSAEPITFDITVNIIRPASIVLSPQYTELVKDGIENPFIVNFPAAVVYDNEGNPMADVECGIIDGDFETLDAYIVDADDGEGEGEETGFQLSKEIPLGTYHLIYGLRIKRMMELTGDGGSMPEITSDYEIIVRNPQISYTADDGGSITGETSQTVEPGAGGAEVTAVPDAGFAFSQWSDGVTTAARTDENITEDLSVAAEFIDNTAPSLTAGTVSRTSNTEATVKFTSNEAGNYYYAVTADGAEEPVIDTSGAGMACTTAETSITNLVGLTTGAKDIYIKLKDAVGNVSAALKIDIPAYIASGSGSGGKGGGGSHSNATTPSSQEPVTVIVNGQKQDAGTETKTTEDGKSTVTVEVDNKVIENKIDEALKNNTTNNNNLFQVPVEDTKSDIAKVGLTGDIVKKLEENHFDVSVKRDNVEYVIPAEEFTISNVAQNLGVAEKDLADIKVEVKITRLDEAVVEKYNEAAKANGAELVFPPVSFEVVANTTTTNGKTGEVEINKFSNYVERVMEIPAGADPSKITTGIVFNADGTYSHVPTTIYQKDGKWYAKLNSLTNSNYSVVWNPVTVKSVENHWAKDAVNDMASRLVVMNPESFEPNNAITRADFAEYIVRALGLYREDSEYENKFKDVDRTGERTLAIQIANEYGIVTGYSDSTFRGDAQITREEAMTMYQRAMKITKLAGTDESRYRNYTDYNQVGNWAEAYVKEVLSAHVFNGTSAATISPKSNMTYAEAAQAIRNLLVESKLINN